MFNCAFVERVWHEVGLWRKVEGYMDRCEGATNLCFVACNELSDIQQFEFAMLMWSIWCNKNELIWEEILDASGDSSCLRILIWDWGRTLLLCLKILICFAWLYFSSSFVGNNINVLLYKKRLLTDWGIREKIRGTSQFACWVTKDGVPRIRDQGRSDTWFLLG